MKQTHIICPGHSRPIAEISYSPMTQDGYFFISACHDKFPMLRNGVTGDWIGTFAGHRGAVWSAKLDNDALLALTCSSDYSAKLWDAVTGDEIHTFPHSHIVKSVDFSTDGRTIITGGYECILREFDITKYDSLALNEIKQTSSDGTKSSITKLKCLSNKLIIVGLATSNIRLFDFKNNSFLPIFDIACDEKK